MCADLPGVVMQIGDNLLSLYFACDPDHRIGAYGAHCARIWGIKEVCIPSKVDLRPAPSRGWGPSATWLLCWLASERPARGCVTSTPAFPSS